tara:strand:+ start:340 stop:588 length:249 start_codon:yes stop_codon:yes gene_type:complete
MSRKITIYKWQGNTDYSVDVEDSYGTVHHLGYYLPHMIDESVEKDAEEIWNNEVKPKEDLMGKAVVECIQMDIDRGVEPSLD